MLNRAATGNPSAIRVLHGLNGTLLGGAELAALSMGVQMRARGDEVLFSVAAKGVAYDECRRLGFSAVEAPHLARPRALADAGRMVAGLAVVTAALAFPRRTAAVLHAHGPARFRTLAPAARVAGVPTICHIHSIPDAPLLRWGFQQAPTVVIPCAGFLREIIESAFEGRRVPRIVPMPYPVDVNRFYPPPSRATDRVALGLAATTELVVVLADLSPNKGIDIAIRAFAKATMGRATNTRLWVVGEERIPCGYRDELLRLVRDHNVDDQVEFVGFRRDVDVILRAAEVLLLPSRSEGMPLSVLEAQASGVPVITSPAGGLPEIVSTGVTGWLVPCDDEVGWATQLRALLDDPALRARVGAASSRSAREHHSLSAYTSKMREVYREALETMRPALRE